MEDITILFEVHKCFKEMKINASLTVDDWASLVIEGKEEDGTQVTPVNIDMLKTAELAGERGGHMLWTKEVKEVKEVILKPGKYTIKITHQNVTYAADYDPKYNDATCNFSILATAVSHLKQEDAKNWLVAYSPVNYIEKSNPTLVWEYCGGAIEETHKDKPDDYYNTCALRMSIRLGNYGKSLAKISGGASMSTVGCDNVFGSTEHVYIRARDIAKYLSNSNLKATHFTSSADYESVLGRKSGDILVFAGSFHCGMATGKNWSLGDYERLEPCWLLFREGSEKDTTSSIF